MVAASNALVLSKHQAHCNRKLVKHLSPSREILSRMLRSGVMVVLVSLRRHGSIFVQMQRIRAGLEGG